MIVAIDGPAGAGKSTVARAVAERLGFTYVDTGALYRAVTWAALKAGIAMGDGPAIAAVAGAVEVRLEGARTCVDGEDVTAQIRSADVTSSVSRVAAHPEVRAVLAGIQQRIAAGSDVVMEGRDIGSTIAPDAPVKIFLTASLEQRAKRRLEQLGLDVDGSSLDDAARS
ncbi:MAG: (d)CMP kinase, partial [Actinomycetota bacterium]|nr:(d)CMP kinase [Actinomycetota bacterium]